MRLFSTSAQPPAEPLYLVSICASCLHPIMAASYKSPLLERAVSELQKRYSQCRHPCCRTMTEPEFSDDPGGLNASITKPFSAPYFLPRQTRHATELIPRVECSAQSTKIVP
jgi:hypothetical protein